MWTDRGLAHADLPFERETDREFNGDLPLTSVAERGADRLLRRAAPPRQKGVDRGAFGVSTSQCHV